MSLEIAAKRHVRVSMYPRSGLLGLRPEPAGGADGDAAPACDVPAPPAYRPLWLAVVFGALADGQLETFAECCRRYTPQISMVPPEALLLEVRGSLRLFGGFTSLIEDVLRMLTGRGCTVAWAATPLPSASLLLARQGKDVLIEDRTRLRAMLAETPVRALGEEWAQLLERMGIRRLKDLWRLPRDGLVCRFGTKLPVLLDRLSGRIPDLQPAHRPPLQFAAACELPMETADGGFILAAARRLLHRLEAFLKSHDAAVGGLRLTLNPPRRAANACRPIECRIGLRSPTRDPVRLGYLLAERLHALRLPEPVLELELRAEDLAQYAPVMGSLLPGRGVVRSERIWEILEAKLGQGCITVPACHADHRPERAGGVARAAGGEKVLPGVRRPLWLLDPPEPLAGNPCPSWRGKALRLDPGPERIESGWWDGAEQRRDYYRAATPDGRPLWVFRDLDSPRGWWLHGYWG